MSLELSFGQIEAVLARLNRIADHKRVAFMSRLKHLQKNGCPGRNRPGRGKAGTFNFSQLMQTALAVDLVQAGLPPALAARIVTGNWLAIRPTVYIATYTKTEVSEINEVRAKVGEPEMDMPEEWLWMMSPEALREMSIEGVGEYDHYEAVLPVSVGMLREQLLCGETVGVTGESWRTLIINGTRLTQKVMTATAFHFRFATWESMRADIKAEIDEDERRFRELSQLIRNDIKPTTPEGRKAIKDRLGDLRETDFSTNPPTPPGMTSTRAKEIILHTDPEILAPVAAKDGDVVEVSSEVLQQLLFLRLFEVEDGQLKPTLLGETVATFLRDPGLAKEKIDVDTSDLGFGDY